jgi:hypothetical protein
MTALSPSQVSRLGGADISTGMVASANGDTIPAGCCLHVKNSGGTVGTVTVVAPTGSGAYGMSYANLALTPTVAATTGDMIYGPFPAGSPFVDPATGLVTFNYSGGTLTVKALQIQD